MNERQLKKERERWAAHLAAIESGTKGVDKAEPGTAKAARIAKARKDFGFFVSHYFPHYAKNETPAFHLKAAAKVLGDPFIKGVVEWFRGAAKSVVFDTFIPLWLMVQERNQARCVVVIGVNETAAIRLLSDIQAELEANQLFLHDYGPQQVAGSWEDKEFSTALGSKFIALGMGQSVRGLRNKANRPDYVVIDDIDTEQMCRNAARLTQVVNWIERAVLGMLDEGPSRLFVVNNRIAKDQVMSRIVQRKPHWWHSFVPGHKDGKSAWPGKFSMEYWARKEQDMGSAAFSTEIMLVPQIEGSHFKAEWITWAKPPKMARVVAYIDPSWRDGAKVDHKACKLWGKPAGAEELDRWCLKAFVRQCSIDELAEWCHDVHLEMRNRKQPIEVEWWIEGKFMQDDLLEDFQRVSKARGWLLPIMPDMRNKPNKEARIHNMIPHYKRGLVKYSEAESKDPDMARAIDHLLAWEMAGDGAPDDSPDADEGALHILDHTGSFGLSGSISIGGPSPGRNKY